MSRVGNWSRHAALAIVAGLVVVAPMLNVLPAQALPPDAPAGLTITRPNDATLILGWDHVAQAIRYRVQVDDDPNFASTAVDTSTVSNTYVPNSTLATNTAFYWRVQAFSSDPNPSGWSVGTFTTGDIEAPLLDSPANGASLDQPASPPLLVWRPVPGASSYLVELSPESTFGASTVTKTTQNTAFVWPDPLVADDWFWRIKASKGQGLVSLPSEERSFTVLPIAQPQIPASADPVGSEVQDVVLDWDPVPGARSYELQVARDPQFVNIIDTRSGILGTRFSPPTTYDNADYSWRVRAVDAAGQPTGWTNAINTFTRSYPQRPTPVHPAATGIEDVPGPVYFQWTPVKHASEYEFQLGTTAGFSAGTYDSCRLAGTTYTPGNFAINTTGQPSTMRTNEDCFVTPGVTNYWRVRALDAPFTKPGDLPGVQGLFSDVQDFRPAPLEIANPNPSGGATVDVPTLTWEAVGSAEKYDIKIFNKTGAQVDAVTTSSRSYTPKGTSQLKATDNPFTWSITANAADGSKSLTHEYTFNVSGTVPADPATPLTPLTPSPSDNTLMEAPSLTWSPLAGAAYYRVNIGQASDGTQVWFAHSSNDLFNQAVPYPAMTEISPRLLNPGSYDWQVTAYDSTNVPIATGPEGRFTVQPIRATTGHSVALGGLQVDPNNLSPKSPCTASTGACTPNSTPVLEWDRDPRVSFYMVYVSRDANFTNLIEPSSAIPATSNSMYAPTLDNSSHTYPDTEGGSRFFWHIRPCRRIFNCAADPVSAVDQAQGTFTKTSPQVRGLAVTPAATAEETNEVTFSWEDYWETNQSAEHTWAQTGEQGTQSARQYRIEVKQGAVVVDTQVVDQATYTSFGKLYPEGTLTWRVQAIDSDNNALPWSAEQTFVKSPPALSLISPVGMASANATMPFRWEAQKYAVTYDLEVYKDNDTTFSPANKIAAASPTGLKTNAFVPTAPLAPSDTNYVWRVRRADASGNKGPWSATGTFVVTKDNLETTAPADGAIVDPNGPTLQWKQLSSATRYDVEIRPVSGAGGTVTASTTATAFTPSTALLNGDYTWKVTGKDASTNSVGTAQASFTVDATIDAVQAPTIVTPSGTGVGKTIQGTAPTWDESLVTTTFQWKRDGTNIGTQLTCAPGQAACTPEYTLTSNDLNKNITLSAVGKRSAYVDGAAESTAIVPTTGDAVANVTKPGIAATPTGGAVTPSVGTRVYATPGAWSPTTTSFTYQWLRNNTPITGATFQAYVIAPADAGQELSVRVTAKLTGYSDGSASSDAVTVVTLEATTAPVISAPEGTRVGATLTSTDPVWNQATGVTNSYQWMRDGQAIYAEKAPTYTLVVADIGKSVTLRVTGAKAEYPAGGTTTSNAIVATAGPAPTNTSLPVITGERTIGKSLTVSTGSWSLPPGYPTYKYQWLRNGTPIASATGATYWLKPEDAAQRISARVTVSVSGYEDGTATATAVTAAKMTSTTTVSLSPTTVKPSQRAKAYVVVSVPGLAKPTGLLVIKDGTKTIKKVTLRASKSGRVTVRLPLIKRVGKHKIKVIYKGNAQVTGSKSKKAILYVKR